MNGKGDTTCRVDFDADDIQVRVAPQTTLLEAAQQAGLSMTATCGGRGRCGQCRLTVLEGKVSPPEDNEADLLPGGLMADGQRLACCTRVSGDVKVDIPRASLAGIHGQATQRGEPEFELEPSIETDTVDTSGLPSMEGDDRAGQIEKLIQSIGAATGRGNITMGSALADRLSDLPRQHQGKINLYRRNNEIVGVASVDEPPLGVAVDLGTTKIAAGLVDLTSGKTLAEAGEPNPQAIFGGDVISRLNHAIQAADATERLADMARSSIDGLIAELVAKAGVSRFQVADLCIVGNTVMTHLLLKLAVDRLAVAPFVATSLEAEDIKARDIGLQTAPEAYVHILPGIGGFVGADHVAMILSSGLGTSADVAIGIDVGTNTEIVLTDPGRQKRVAASCASGPAFEGGHIRSGMRATTGAIEAVSVADDDIDLKTIGDAPPVGLCGSGIIDAVAILHRLSIINERGRINGAHRRVREGTDGKEVVLALAQSSGNGQDVVLTQQDINQVQLAKGAIRAGLDCLLAETGTPAEAVREVVIAGAFGSFLNVANARYIGLLPPLPNAGFHQIGNAALEGARRALLSRHERQHAVDLAQHTTSVDLTRVAGFNRCFAKGMLFL